jgi:hypothetical protein
MERLNKSLRKLYKKLCLLGWKKWEGNIGWNVCKNTIVNKNQILSQFKKSTGGKYSMVKNLTETFSPNFKFKICQSSIDLNKLKF